MEAAARAGVGIALLFDHEIVGTQPAAAYVKTPRQLKACPDETHAGVKDRVLVHATEKACERIANGLASLPFAVAAWKQSAKRRVRLEGYGELIEICCRKLFQEKSRSGELGLIG